MSGHIDVSGVPPPPQPVAPGKRTSGGAPAPAPQRRASIAGAVSQAGGKRPGMLNMLNLVSKIKNKKSVGGALTGAIPEETTLGQSGRGAVTGTSPINKLKSMMSLAAAVGRAGVNIDDVKNEISKPRPPPKQPEIKGGRRPSLMGAAVMGVPGAQGPLQTLPSYKEFESRYHEENDNLAIAHFLVDQENAHERTSIFELSTRKQDMASPVAIDIFKRPSKRIGDFKGHIERPAALGGQDTFTGEETAGADYDELKAHLRANRWQTVHDLPFAVLYGETKVSRQIQKRTTQVLRDSDLEQQRLQALQPQASQSQTKLESQGSQSPVADRSMMVPKRLSGAPPVVKFPGQGSRTDLIDGDESEMCLDEVMKNRKTKRRTEKAAKKQASSMLVNYEMTQTRIIMTFVSANYSRLCQYWETTIPDFHVQKNCIGTGEMKKGIMSLFFTDLQRELCWRISNEELIQSIWMQYLAPDLIGMNKLTVKTSAEYIKTQVSNFMQNLLLRGGAIAPSRIRKTRRGGRPTTTKRAWRGSQTGLMSAGSESGSPGGRSDGSPGDRISAKQRRMRDQRRDTEEDRFPQGKGQYILPHKRKLGQNVFGLNNYGLYPTIPGTTLMGGGNRQSLKGKLASKYGTIQLEGGGLDPDEDKVNKKWVDVVDTSRGNEGVVRYKTVGGVAIPKIDFFNMGTYCEKDYFPFDVYAEREYASAVNRNLLASGVSRDFHQSAGAKFRLFDFRAQACFFANSSKGFQQKFFGASVFSERKFGQAFPPVFRGLGRGFNGTFWEFNNAGPFQEQKVWGYDGRNRAEIKDETDFISKHMMATQYNIVLLKILQALLHFDQKTRNQFADIMASDEAAGEAVTALDKANARKSEKAAKEGRKNGLERQKTFADKLIQIAAAQGKIHALKTASSKDTKVGDPIFGDPGSLLPSKAGQDPVAAIAASIDKKTLESAKNMRLCDKINKLIFTTVGSKYTSEAKKDMKTSLTKTKAASNGNQKTKTFKTEQNLLKNAGKDRKSRIDSASGFTTPRSSHSGQNSGNSGSEKSMKLEAKSRKFSPSRSPLGVSRKKRYTVSFGGAKSKSFGVERSQPFMESGADAMLSKSQSAISNSQKALATGAKGMHGPKAPPPVKSLDQLKANDRLYLICTEVGRQILIRVLKKLSDKDQASLQVFNQYRRLLGNQQKDDAPVIPKPVAKKSTRAAMLAELQAEHARDMKAKEEKQTKQFEESGRKTLLKVGTDAAKDANAAHEADGGPSGGEESNSDKSRGRSGGPLGESTGPFGKSALVKSSAKKGPASGPKKKIKRKPAVPVGEPAPTTQEGAGQDADETLGQSQPKKRTPQMGGHGVLCRQATAPAGGFAVNLGRGDTMMDYDIIHDEDDRMSESSTESSRAAKRIREIAGRISSASVAMVNGSEKGGKYSAGRKRQTGLDLTESQQYMSKVYDELAENKKQSTDFLERNKNVQANVNRMSVRKGGGGRGTVNFGSGSSRPMGQSMTVSAIAADRRYSRAFSTQSSGRLEQSMSLRSATEGSMTPAELNRMRPSAPKGRWTARVSNSTDPFNEARKLVARQGTVDLGKSCGTQMKTTVFTLTGKGEGLNSEDMVRSELVSKSVRGGGFQGQSTRSYTKDGFKKKKAQRASRSRMNLEDDISEGEEEETFASQAATHTVRGMKSIKADGDLTKSFSMHAKYELSDAKKEILEGGATLAKPNHSGQRSSRRLSWGATTLKIGPEGEEGDDGDSLVAARLANRNETTAKRDKKLFDDLFKTVILNAELDEIDETFADYGLIGKGFCASRELRNLREQAKRKKQEVTETPLGNQLRGMGIDTNRLLSYKSVDDVDSVGFMRNRIRRNLFGKRLQEKVEEHKTATSDVTMIIPEERWPVPRRKMEEILWYESSSVGANSELRKIAVLNKVLHGALPVDVLGLDRVQRAALQPTRKSTFDARASTVKVGVSGDITTSQETSDIISASQSTSKSRGDNNSRVGSKMIGSKGSRPSKDGVSKVTIDAPENDNSGLTGIDKMVSGIPSAVSGRGFISGSSTSGFAIGSPRSKLGVSSEVIKKVHSNMRPSTWLGGLDESNSKEIARAISKEEGYDNLKGGDYGGGGSEEFDNGGKAKSAAMAKAKAKHGKQQGKLMHLSRFGHLSSILGGADFGSSSSSEEDTLNSVDRPVVGGKSNTWQASQDYFSAQESFGEFEIKKGISLVKFPPPKTPSDHQGVQHCPNNQIGHSPNH